MSRVRVTRAQVAAAAARTLIEDILRDYTFDAPDPRLRAASELLEAALPADGPSQQAADVLGLRALKGADHFADLQPQALLEP